MKAQRKRWQYGGSENMPKILLHGMLAGSLRRRLRKRGTCEGGVMATQLRHLAAYGKAKQKAK
jgi:hypothetical protein